MFPVVQELYALDMLSTCYMIPLDSFVWTVQHAHTWLNIDAYC